MQRGLRLRGEKRFALIHREGRSWANQLLVLRVLPNDLEISRFGFLTGRRIGKAATRNRVKRRLREGVRASRVKSGWDAILIARREAATANFHQLKQALHNLFSKARLLEPHEPGA